MKTRNTNIIFEEGISKSPDTTSLHYCESDTARCSRNYFIRFINSKHRTLTYTLELFTVSYSTKGIYRHPSPSLVSLSSTYGDIEASEVFGRIYAPIDGKSCEGSTAGKLSQLKRISFGWKSPEKLLNSYLG
ncbi:hypothetical protein CEXT_693961 [Caerostris extrusa]|uniref:Uncharacterized protein n=1 Tax=Caerostris extrusa TaxID=172846 RepID=A0AAV4Y884_CAEEX|nr:hypothetical protein CEXT_693961 [Caerostris extrusa]